MAGNRQPRVVITIEHLIQHRLASDILICGNFTLESLPEEILLWKPSFDLVFGERVVDIRLVSSLVTSVAADTLSE